MVKDIKAEALEAKGLYRRAAARWTEVMLMCSDDNEREWIKRRCDMCLERVRRLPVKPECYSALHTAAADTQHRMGIAQPDGSAFRQYGRSSSGNGKKTR